MSNGGSSTLRNARGFTQCQRMRESTRASRRAVLFVMFLRSTRPFWHQSAKAIKFTRVAFFLKFFFLDFFCKKLPIKNGVEDYTQLQDWIQNRQKVRTSAKSNHCTVNCVKKYVTNY